MAINDCWIYRHAYSEQTREGRSLDPSGNGYVPTSWHLVDSSREERLADEQRAEFREEQRNQELDRYERDETR